MKRTTLMKSSVIKAVARIMIMILTFQIIAPATKVFALTSGPSQPEVQSFEPVGTTDMVDLFSGDFVYNIPLLDIEGYPVNISYHSGINMEQEASWVGLGWNINPGEINRAVRGLPDDFDGEKVKKKLQIKDEKNFRMDVGMNVGFEFLGAFGIGLSAGNYISYNNYRGMGVGANVGINFSTPYAKTGLGVSVGSQEGADIDAHVGLSFASSDIVNGNSGSISFSGSTGFNTRTGLRDIGFSVGAGINSPSLNKLVRYDVPLSRSYSSTIPIGLQNYVAVVTNESTLKAFALQLKVGAEVFFGYPSFNIGVSVSKLSHAKNGTKKAYGYLYAQHADNESVMDFSREKDGVYNETLPYLPLSSMTYDVYAVSGQGTGGMFRPFRNDIGSVYDPKVVSTTFSNSDLLELGTPIGPVGGLFEFGMDISILNSKVESGPWFIKPFREKQEKKIYENTYFKQAGDMAYSLLQKTPNIASHSPVYIRENNSLYSKTHSSLGAAPTLVGGENNRNSRSNYLSYFTNKEAAMQDVAMHDKLESYPMNGFLNNSGNILYRPRLHDNSKINRPKQHHIGEMTQVLPDGRRYIYGLPAMNNLQREMTFSIPAPGTDNIDGIVSYSTEYPSLNGPGREAYYQETVTPAYAHSYLLTESLASDYVDITGDGPTEDDLGSYTKFNYTMVDSDYRWRAPYAKGSENKAQYIPGYWSDKEDDKAQYIIGSKEIWHLHSIESKNYIAEFYTSVRQDGKGVKKAVVPNNGDMNDVEAFLKNTLSGESNSYKLDSIKLFSKNDRLLNSQNATPVKTVIFQYDYSLCPGIPNTSATNGGKLTLKRIYFKYGKSSKSLLSPYVFNYDNVVNASYSFADKDRWGNYKPNAANGSTPSNYEFPYTKQDAEQANLNASNWHLTKIKMPSGGTLQINYEADDYSYVQDKHPMEMFMVKGVGSSPDYEPKNVLYENINSSYNYIYFLRSPQREQPGKSMKDNYLENTDMLYFSFNLDIAARNRYENIKGYAKAVEIDVCPNNSQYGYVKIKKESAGNKSSKMIHAVTLAGLNTGRYYLPHIIYPGYSGNGASDMEVMEGMVSATKELFSIWKNANERFVKNGLARVFKPAKSWIRLSTPGYTKIGGGSRVKSLVLNNEWSEMVSNGDDATFGKQYSYTLDDPQYSGRSSGVASYEPLIGGDENVLRQPVKYTADAGRLLPAIEFYQEEPLGESFYPAPSVGYSRVAVKSIHQEDGKSSQAEDVYEFYTAKDFPIQAEFTPKSTPISEKHKSMRKKTEKLGVVQGYTLIMNDMHGKAKSVSNYVLKDDNRELITQVKYHYQTDDKGRLNNEVKALIRNNNNISSPEWAIDDVVLGEEVDFTVDNRKRYMESLSNTISFNLNVVNFLFVVVPVPTCFFPDKYEESLFETAVSTKIVQQYGILKSVESIDHGARTLTENLLYDGETGQVILSKVNNEFNDPVSNLRYPAYWAYQNMGPAYYNTGYEETADTLYVDDNGKGYLAGLADKKMYNAGDELLAEYKIGTTQYAHKLWITGAAEVIIPIGYETKYYPCEYECGCDSPTDYGHGWCPVPIYSTTCALTVEPRAIHPAGTSDTWLPAGTIVTGVHIKVLRSGRRNLLDKSVQNIALAGAIAPAQFSDLFGSQLDGKVLATAATLYNDNHAPGDVITNSGYGLNQYVKGLLGNYRERESYAWLSPRNYSNSHARRDGVLQAYQNPWYMGNPNPETNPCVMEQDNRITWYPAQAGENWKFSRTIQYNAYGLPVQETDAANISSTVLYGYNYTLPVAVANNAKEKEVVYYNFEDLLGYRNINFSLLGILQALAPEYPSGGSIPVYDKYNYGKIYRKYYSNFFGANMTISQEAAHTGIYSMKFAGPGKILLGNQSNFGNGEPNYYISMWVKPISGTPPVAGQFQMEVNTTSYNAFWVSTGSIDGWYKLEGMVDLPNSSTATVGLKIPSGFYVDDVRFCPDQANMKSFAYHPLTLRLMAELDENNFATFYEYDQEGALIRVKKETDKGILTVNEHRKSVKKQ